MLKSQYTRNYINHYLNIHNVYPSVFALKMFLGRSKKVIKSSSLSIRRKLGLVVLLLSIFLVSISELVALSLGKQSNRQ